MAKFESHYKELRFHAEGKQFKFTNGVFFTEDPKVMKALEKVQFAQKIEEAPKEEEKPKRKPKPKADEAAE
jgi:hypothetical protein